MRILTEIDLLIKELEKKGKYVRSGKTKQKLKYLYTSHWLPLSSEKGVIKKQELSNLFEEIFSNSKKDYFLKFHLKSLLKKAKIILEENEIEQLKKGVKFKDDLKEELYFKLKDKKLNNIIIELKKAELNIYSNPDNSCMHSREACEEFLRVSRLNLLSEDKPRETLTQHSSSLRNKKFLGDIEHQFLSSGLYGFLSGKGKHANKEKKTPQDALFGFKLSIITLEYLITKGLI